METTLSKGSRLKRLYIAQMLLMGAIGLAAIFVTAAKSSALMLAAPCFLSGVVLNSSDARKLLREVWMVVALLAFMFAFAVYDFDLRPHQNLREGRILDGLAFLTLISIYVTAFKAAKSQQNP